MIKVIYEDNSIIIIEKSAGLAAQSANVLQPDCVSLIKDHLKRSEPDIKKEPYVGVVHRLDQPVAGILVFAKNRESAANLSRQIRDGLMNKHYRAVVEGIIASTEETMLTDMMYKDAKAGKAIICDTGRDNVKLRECRLKFRKEREIPQKNMTVLSIDLLTGRFHQIRAQLAHMGHPIVGDAKYGAVTKYPSGIALVADRLEFIHPVTGEKVEKVVDFSFAL